MISRVTTSCIILLFLMVPALHAGNTGKIAGKVIDAKTKEPLVGANVIVVGTSLGAATDLQGQFSIINIPPNTYTIKASILGYDPVEVRGLQVNIDLTTRNDFELNETVVEQKEVIITAERPAIQKDLTATTAVVGGDQIAALPVTEVTQVLNLQAGYVAGSLRGGRSGEVAYWIDGVPVTDPYDGSQVVEINKSSVQELQLVSGAFNAEYGQAMSGVVNIATKEGGQKYTGTIGVYGGQYYTNDPDVFPGLTKFKPTTIRDIEGDVSGPLVGDNVSFFANLRSISFGGDLYGYNRFNPWNVGYTDPITQKYTISRDPTTGYGDSSLYPMNNSYRSYAQGKITWKIAPSLKLNTNFIYDYNKSKPYNRAFFYDPAGVGTNYSWSSTSITQLTHTLSANTFYTLGFSFFDKLYRYYLYDLPYAPAPDSSGDLWEVMEPSGVPMSTQHYVHPSLLTTPDTYSFFTGGTDNNIFRRRTITKVGKFDITSQVDQTNLVKFGVEYRKHNLLYDNVQLQPLATESDFNVQSSSPFIRTRIEPTSSIYHDYYDHAPTEISSYLQDKMEFKDLIVNIGIRFDYFDPDGVVLNDESDPDIYAPVKPENVNQTLAQRMTHWYHSASTKTQWSPRFGASFPITATGVVHFSYGHFFQIPSFELLYQNPGFKLNQGTGPVGIVGNSDLSPEQTVSGEIGIQQQITQDVNVDLTAYMRDIRNLAGTRADQIIIFGGSATYNKFVNSDFGTVKGIVLTMTKRFGGGFSSTLDYTYQVASGSASDPSQAENAIAGGNLPEVELTPLNWDQRHTLNVTAAYDSKKWGMSFIGQYGSGTPYTPRLSTDITTLLINSGTKPSFFNLDMRAFYNIPVDVLHLVLYARVFNLLDIRNELNVFDDTGRAGFTTDEAAALKLHPAQVINSIDQFYTQPTNFSEPRRIEIGMNLEF
ncbi:MAG TPA: TonB-dependent receptor [Bacteroidota bacterium]|nr:TonB-dependent receptor [Bacteroidota bacterium]